VSLRALAAFAIAAALGGCQPSSNICGQTLEKMVGDDGQTQRCIAAEDCPQPSGVRICVTDGPYEAECVGCDHSECTLHRPVLCQ
jgi:hypothetical protein